MNDRHPWFPALEPLPGGEQRLRRAMQARPTAPAWRWAPAAAACALLLVALALRPPLPARSQIDRALRVAWPLPATPRIENGHSRELVSGEPDVRLYAVVITPAPVQAPGP